MSHPFMTSSEFMSYLLECRNYLELAGGIGFDDCVEIMHDAVTLGDSQTDYLTAWEVYDTVIPTVTTTNPGQSEYYLPTPIEFLEGVTLLHNNH